MRKIGGGLHEQANGEEGRVMLSLPTVTLCAVDTACHALTALALQDCMSQATFGDVLILSDKLLPVRGARFSRIAPCSSAAAQAHCWYTVPGLVQTAHYLIIQWDSWIIEPNAWTDDFLTYDYVGAPWGWHGDGHEVGNGGFSLRSKRLGDYVAAHSDTLPFRAPEDAALCRSHRKALEREGFRWAPTNIAARFSIERSALNRIDQHFGYHGMFNWPMFLTREKIAARMMHAPEYVWQSAHCREMQSALNAIDIDENKRQIEDAHIRLLEEPIA